MKALLLILGVAGLVAAGVWAAVTQLGLPIPEAIVDQLPEPLRGFVAEPPPPPAPPPVPVVVATGPTEAELRALDEQDIIEILLARIEATPPQLDDAWLAGFCRYVRNGDDLQAFWDSVRVAGERYKATYKPPQPEVRPTAARPASAGQAEVRQAPRRVAKPVNPLLYVFQAREFIYAQPPNAKSLLTDSRGLLAMAVYVSWQASIDELRKQEAKKQRLRPEEVQLPEGAGRIDEELKMAYFSESLGIYGVLAGLVAEAGHDPRVYREEVTLLHEAALVDRYLLALRQTEEARERFTGSALSSAAATVVIGRAQPEINAHLLALGKVYVDGALAEMAFRGRQQQEAERGFQALALVYQRSKSGEALRVMRESNRIMRYNLWQMARMSWKSAKALAQAGRRAEADDEFLVAKQHYLRCLSMLERSKKPVVLDEYRRLQADITAWVKSKGGAASGSG